MLLSRCPDFSVTWLDLLINAFYWAPKYGSIIKISPNHHITHHKSSHQSSKILTTLNEKKNKKQMTWKDTSVTLESQQNFPTSWGRCELEHMLYIATCAEKGLSPSLAWQTSSLPTLCDSPLGSLLEPWLTGCCHVLTFSPLKLPFHPEPFKAPLLHNVQEF